MYKKHEELLINWKHLFQKEGGNYTQESAKPWQVFFVRLRWDSKIDDIITDIISFSWLKMYQS